METFGMIYQEQVLGGSLKGQTFSTILGNLITEVTIKQEVRVCGGPMMGRYITLDKANDAFVKTSHAMAKFTSKLKEQFNLLSSCVHKDLSPRSRKYHDNIVTDMKEKI